MMIPNRMETHNPFMFQTTNQPFIVDLPIKKGGFRFSCVQHPHALKVEIPKCLLDMI